MIPAQGVRKSYSQTAFMQRGTSPLTMWYCGAQNQVAFGVYGPATTGVLLLRLMVLARPAVVSKLSVEVTTVSGAGGVVRPVIYRAISLTNLYPGSLVVDGGELDVTGLGVKTVSGLAVALSAGVYWTGVFPGVSAASFRAVSNIGDPHLLGALNTLATLRNRIFAVVAYGAAPASFPAGATVDASATIPAVAMEFA